MKYLLLENHVYCLACSTVHRLHLKKLECDPTDWRWVYTGMHPCNRLEPPPDTIEYKPTQSWEADDDDHY